MSSSLSVSPNKAEFLCCKNGTRLWDRQQIMGLPYMTSAKCSYFFTPPCHCYKSADFVPFVCFLGIPTAHPLRTSHMEAPLSCCGPFNLDPPSIPSRDFLVSRISRNINRGRRVRLISRQATAQLLHACVLERLHSAWMFKRTSSLWIWLCLISSVWEESLKI